MTIRTVEALIQQAPLSQAEEQVLAKLDTGKDTVLGNGELPGPGDQTRRVRAALIRLLMLGDDRLHRLHEKGLRLSGAWLPDKLDLEGCRDLPDLLLYRCRFDEPPVFLSASLNNLILSGSYLPGLYGDRLEAKGDIFLRNIEASGAVRLLGAKLGGALSCSHARFRGGQSADGSAAPAFSADGLEAKDGVYFHGVEANREVRFMGAKLGGSLDCTKASFRAGNDARGKPTPSFSADALEVNHTLFMNCVDAIGEVRLLGAKLGRDLDCSGATFQTGGDAVGTPRPALNLHGVSVIGTFSLRQGSRVNGVLNLTAAKVGSIADEKACWPGEGDLLLNRFRYGAFIDQSPIDAEFRLSWLARQSPSRWGSGFWPQPYEQLAKVLREMGHGSDARQVLVEKERLHRYAVRARVAGRWRWFGLLVWDTLLAWTVRYGRQPLLAFVWLLMFFLIGWSFFQTAADDGTIKPNNAFVLRSAEWADCVPDGSRNEGSTQLDCFLAQPEAQSYPRFNSAIYSLDTLLPIVSLEMQEYWIPDETNDGGWARVYLWVHIAVGWALSLLAVAGFSGLVKSD